MPIAIKPILMGIQIVATARINWLKNNGKVYIIPKKLGKKYIFLSF